MTAQSKCQDTFQTRLEDREPERFVPFDQHCVASGLLDPLGNNIAVSDRELLELVLERSAPISSISAIASHLLEKFGSFAEVLSANHHKLAEFGKCDETVCNDLALIRIAAQRLLRGMVCQRPLMSCWSELIDYCRSLLAFETREVVLIIFLDDQQRIIGDEVHSLGSAHRAPVYVREIMLRCLVHNASGLVIVHNHPSGDLTPSQLDIEQTREIAQTCLALDITLLDHFIVARDGFVSLRNAQLF